MYYKGTKVRTINVDDPFVEGKIGIIVKIETYDNRPGYIVSFQGTEVWLDKDYVRPCFPKDEYDYPLPIFKPGDRVYRRDYLFEDYLYYGTVINHFINDRSNRICYLIQFDEEDEPQKVQEEELNFIPVVTEEFKELMGV